jgi:hypothetical protein
VTSAPTSSHWVTSRCSDPSDPWSGSTRAVTLRGPHVRPRWVVGLVQAGTCRRLRLHGIIERIPHTNTYTLTTDGIRVAVFYNKVDNRVLRPLIAAADQPPAPIELRRALATIAPVINGYTTSARLGTAA